MYQLPLNKDKGWPDFFDRGPNLKIIFHCGPRKVINLEYRDLEPRKWHVQNFFLETILVSKTVFSNLILNGITSTKDATNRTQMLGTKKEAIFRIMPSKCK